MYPSGEPVCSLLVSVRRTQENHCRHVCETYCGSTSRNRVLKVRAILLWTLGLFPAYQPGLQPASQSLLAPSNPHLSPSDCTLSIMIPKASTSTAGLLSLR